MGWNQSGLMERFASARLEGHCWWVGVHFGWGEVCNYVSCMRRSLARSKASVMFLGVSQQHHVGGDVFRSWGGGHAAAVSPCGSRGEGLASSALAAMDSSAPHGGHQCCCVAGLPTCGIFTGVFNPS